MIKVVFSEVDSPTKAEDAIDLGRTTNVRAINTLKTCATVHIIDQGGEKLLTLGPNESILLKKSLEDKVYSSSKLVRISGVSIY